MENEYVVGPVPTADAPTISEWSTILLPIKILRILEVWRYVVFFISRQNYFRLDFVRYHIPFSIFSMPQSRLFQILYKRSHYRYFCIKLRGYMKTYDLLSRSYNAWLPLYMCAHQCDELPYILHHESWMPSLMTDGASLDAPWDHGEWH